MNSIDNFDEKATKMLSFLENEYVSSYLIVLLVIYGSMVAPKIPPTMINLFKHSWFKFLVIFLIAYLFSPKKSAVTALVTAILLLVITETIERFYCEPMMNMNYQDDESHQKNILSHLTPEEHNMIEQAKALMDEGRLLIDEGNYDEGKYLFKEAHHIIHEVKKMKHHDQNYIPEPPKMSEGNYQESTQLMTEGKKLIGNIKQMITDKKQNVSNMIDPDMENKVGHVISEAKRIEMETGKKISPNELHDLCTQVNDEYSFSKLSLSQYYGGKDWEPRRVEPNMIPGAVTTGELMGSGGMSMSMGMGVGGSEYATVLD
jgi:DNA replication initiation complex subunit (GINS family)